MSNQSQKKTASAAKKTAAAANIDAVTPAGNVEQIRDILFGNQMREYDRQFSRLEERILSEITQLRTDVVKRYEALEEYVRREFEQLNERVDSEKNDRIDVTKTVREEISRGEKSLESKLVKLEEQTSRSGRELRQQILEQSKQLSGEIQEKEDKSMQRMDRHIEALRADKVARITLSELFSELALRLQDDNAMSLGITLTDAADE